MIKKQNKQIPTFLFPNCEQIRHKPKCASCSNKAAKHSPTGLSFPVEMRVPPGIWDDGKRIDQGLWQAKSIYHGHVSLTHLLCLLASSTLLPVKVQLR